MGARGSRGQRVGRDAVLDDQLGLHDLAGTTGNHEPHVAEGRIADPSLEARPGGSLVRVNGLDDLAHQPVGRLREVG